LPLRIIAGQFGGRRLNFPEAGGVRPTGNRVRETLFNWLGDEVVSARVLDLFAGTGALGIEALSRGGAFAVFVERSGRLAGALQQNLTTLGIAEARVQRRDAERYLGGSPEPFDIVFLDPPFNSAIIGSICGRLETGGWLAPGGLVYIEYDGRAGRPPVPAAWDVVREKDAGGVGFALARRNEVNAGS
jgi:16S rRNA (guanine966-N2)-methyltransferase